VLRDAVINNVSTRLEMATAQFIELLKAVPKQGRLRTAREFEEENAGEPTEPQLRLAPLSNTTRLLCQLILLSPDVRSWLLTQPWEPLFQALPEAELLITAMRARFDPEVPAAIAAFLSTCEADEQDALAELLDAKSLSADPMRAAADCWRDLERRDLERQRDELQAHIRKPGLGAEEHAKLHNQVMELQKRITAVRA